MRERKKRSKKKWSDIFVERREINCFIDDYVQSVHDEAHIKIKKMKEIDKKNYKKKNEIYILIEFIRLVSR